MYQVIYINAGIYGNFQDFSIKWPSFRNLISEIFDWSELPELINNNEGTISQRACDPDDELICPSANIDYRTQNISFLKDDRQLKIVINETNFNSFYTIELLSADRSENFNFIASKYKTEISLELDNIYFKQWEGLLATVYGASNLVKGPVIIQNNIGCSDEQVLWRWFRSQVMQLSSDKNLPEIFPVTDFFTDSYKISTAVKFDFYKKKDISIYFEKEVQKDCVSTLAFPDYLVLRVYEDNAKLADWIKALQTFNPEDWS